MKTRGGLSVKGYELYWLALDAKKIDRGESSGHTAPRIPQQNQMNSGNKSTEKRREDGMGTMTSRDSSKTKPLTRTRSLTMMSITETNSRNAISSLLIEVNNWIDSIIPVHIILWSLQFILLMHRYMLDSQFAWGTTLNKPYCSVLPYRSVIQFVLMIVNNFLNYIF